jgi:uncharacterized protein YpmS
MTWVHPIHIQSMVNKTESTWVAKTTQLQKLIMSYLEDTSTNVIKNITIRIIITRAAIIIMTIKLKITIIMINGE